MPSTGKFGNYRRSNSTSSDETSEENYWDRDSGAQDEPEESLFSRKEKGLMNETISASETNRNKSALDMDDVGTDDEEFSETVSLGNGRSDYDLTDFTDIEDQISDAHDTFTRDKQSLKDVIGLVDEVTIKGENLARKLSDTNFLRRESFSGQHLAEKVFIHQNDSETSEPFNRIGAMSNDWNENQGLGRVEYLTTSDLESGNEDTKDEEEEDSDKETAKSLSSKSRTLINDNSVKSYLHSAKNKSATSERVELSAKPSQTSVVSETLGKSRDIESVSNDNHDEDESNYDPVDEQWNEIKESTQENGFAPINGGGDGQRDNEIIIRLKKLRDDITRMRENLSNARNECNKESQEVTKLIAGIMERNRAAECAGNYPTISAVNAQFITPPRTPTGHLTSFIMEDPVVTCGRSAMPAYSGSTGLLAGRLPVVPTVLLEERLRATRETASTTYRATLDELEKMVKKEMASIQDSMSRLEPLNQIASEWNSSQQHRSMTFKRDYRMELTSEMRLQAQQRAKIPTEEM